MCAIATGRLKALLIVFVATSPAIVGAGAQHAQADAAALRGPFPWNYEGVLPRSAQQVPMGGNCPSTAPTPRVLLAGDSWAQYMWDDNAHNITFDKYGQADKLAVSRSLGSNPGANYNGPEYAISGSEAREWVNTASYPWVANVVAELNANPSIDSIMFSLGGNDILAGKSGGGYYKDMDLDVPGSKEALFATILGNSTAITDAFTAVRPDVDVLVSSYEYPNFNVSTFFCGIYACPKRRDLSRDPDGALITDAEINAMNIDVETRRIALTNTNPRLHFDNGDGEMHYFYGDGVSAPGILPRPGQTAPLYAPFPGGNPSRPALRSNFRLSFGISADPIHLNPAGYLYKVAVQTDAYFFPKFRGAVSTTLQSLGGNQDGWTDGVSIGTDTIRMGDDGTRLTHGIVTFNTSTIPAGETIESASIYLLQDARTGTNPFTSGSLGAPRLDVAGQFGAAQVEPGDATALATASDAGCFVGSANAKYYALRIDLTPAAITAIRRDGITQFRVQFSNVNPNMDRVNFSTGDAVLVHAELVPTRSTIDEVQGDGSVRTREVEAVTLANRGLADLLGSTKPFLDIRYADNNTIFEDGFDVSGPVSANH